MLSSDSEEKRKEERRTHANKGERTLKCMRKLRVDEVVKRQVVKDTQGRRSIFSSRSSCIFYSHFVITYG
eukprot:768427-Hanusia_phi.AAC.4